MWGDSHESMHGSHTSPQHATAAAARPHENNGSIGWGGFDPPRSHTTIRFLSAGSRSPCNCNATTTIFPIPIRAHHRSRPGAPPFFVHTLYFHGRHSSILRTPPAKFAIILCIRRWPHEPKSQGCSPLERSDPIPGRELSNCGAGVGASPTVLAVVVAWHHPVPSIDLAGGRADESTYETTEPRYGM
jgi:hypothetical protein